jgi:hypothetical protein
MANDDAIKIGLVNAIAAIGRLAKANAPPPNMPAHKQVMMICPPLGAAAKNSNGDTAQRHPRKNALRVARWMERAVTLSGFPPGTRHLDPVPHGKKQYARRPNEHPQAIGGIPKGDDEDQRIRRIRQHHPRKILQDDAHLLSANPPGKAFIQYGPAKIRQIARANSAHGRVHAIEHMLLVSRKRWR